ALGAQRSGLNFKCSAGIIVEPPDQTLVDDKRNVEMFKRIGQYLEVIVSKGQFISKVERKNQNGETEF
ncbi:hypothetical protein LCGC14_3122180, partial [marine sediment metagenome]